MPSIKRILLWSLIIVFVLLIALLCLSLVRSNKTHKHLVLYGNVDVRQVDIGFRVPGQVKELLFEEGDLVPTGTLMATMDQTPYDGLVREAEGKLESVLADFKNAEILLKRRRELIFVGGVSQEDLDNAQANRDQLEADLYAAEASLAVAKDNLSYTQAFAPTDGVILTRIREPGTVVRESDPVYTLSVSSPVWIRAFVDEPHLGQIQFGMEAEVSTDTPRGKTYKGKVGFISPVAEFTPKTVQTTSLRTDLVYRLRIYVDNPDFGLKQGMPVTVTFNLREK